jgi:Mce-associated membrane protein
VTSDSPQPAPSSSRLTGHLRTYAVALGALCLALLVASVVLAVQVRSRSASQQALDQARADAVVAARQEMLNLDALSAATYDKDLARILAGATGTFQRQAASSFALAMFKKPYLDRKSVSSGTIVAAGVVRADRSTATVLVADDRLLRDTSLKTGSVAKARWQFDMEKHDGHWLLANLERVL